MAGAKRVPSSLVQLTTSIGRSVSKLKSFSVRITSSPVRTPAMPSYLPPVGWVSRWLPMTTGGSSGRLPGRRANMLPSSSISTVQPAASHHERKRSRPSRSRSVSVCRLQPPLAVPPIFAISKMVCISRSPSILMLVGFSVTGRSPKCVFAGGYSAAFRFCGFFGCAAQVR